MVANGTKGISSTPSSVQQNTDDWKKFLEQRSEETTVAKNKWEGAKTVWHTTWSDMQTNWTNLLSAKNAFGIFNSNKSALETKKEDIIAEMNCAVKLAEDNAREQALREGKTEAEAEQIANNAGDSVRSGFIKKLVNASFQLTKLMPSFNEKLDLLNFAQKEYGDSRLANNGAQFDLSFYGRQYADASSLELKAKQNLAIAEKIVGQNLNIENA